MKYTTGSRIYVNGVGCTVHITDGQGNPVVVKRDCPDVRGVDVFGEITDKNRDKIKIKPIIQD